MASSIRFAMLATRAEDSTAPPPSICARPIEPWNGAPIAGSLTFHHLMILISAACLGLTVVSTVFLSWRHLHRYTAPQEQRQILRIVNLPAAYAIFNFLALCFYSDFLFIAPIAGIYEAFTVGALFLLFLEYVAPDGTDREKYFAAMPPVKGKKGKTTPALQWYYQTYGTVMQYPIAKLVLTIIEIVTQYFGKFCENSFSPQYAHLWLTLFDFLILGGAFGATIGFAKQVRTDISPVHKARNKIWSLLGLLIFQMLQDIVFGILNGKLFKPSAKITYNDINFGLPACLTCIESIVFSLIFHWSYSAGEFKEGMRNDRYGIAPATRTHTFKAILNAINLSDVIAGTFTAFQLLFMRLQNRNGGGATQSYNGRKLDQTGMEPLSGQAHANRMRGYSGASDFDAQYSPPLETEYEGGLHQPPMPRAARDPSPGRQQTFRADDLRPQYGRQQYGNGQEYAPLTGQRDPSPSGLPHTAPREMM